MAAKRFRFVTLQSESFKVCFVAADHIGCPETYEIITAYLKRFSIRSGSLRAEGIDEGEGSPSWTQTHKRAANSFELFSGVLQGEAIDHSVYCFMGPIGHIPCYVYHSVKHAACQRDRNRIGRLAQIGGEQ
jgi:hypothetical protein